VPREPALSSDGGRLAFVTFREGTREIWISSASGDGGTAVTTREMEFEAVASPSFAPERNRLTFEGTPRGREPQIYVIGINGGELVQLTRSGGTKPTWSPNEAFVATRAEVRRASIA
jgi:Tol biopolymer transport system component